MATTIGRAGKQVFSALVSPGPNVDGSLNSPIPVGSPNPLTSPPLSTTKPTNFSDNYNTQKLSSFKLRESNSLSKLETVSNDNELEKTLQECLTLDTEPAFSPKAVPYTPKTPHLQTPKLGDPHYSQISSSFTPSSTNKSTPPISTTTFFPTQNEPPKKLNTMQTMEKEQLLAELRQLKMQNEILTNEIINTKLESQTQLENERNEKAQMIQNLEKENALLLQQLLSEKLQSEATLEKEKQNFIDSIKKMEEEKTYLELKVYNLEDSQRSEIGVLTMEKSMYENQLQELERKQQETIEQLNQTKIENFEIITEFNSKEDELLLQLKSLEQDKNNLMLLIQENMRKKDLENARLSKEIDEMKNLMFEKFSLMEKERNLLTEKLQLAEKNVVTQTSLLNNQIEKQKIQTYELVESLEKEKQQILLLQQQQQQQQSSSRLLQSTERGLSSPSLQRQTSSSTTQPLSILQQFSQRFPQENLNSNEDTPSTSLSSTANFERQESKKLTFQDPNVEKLIQEKTLLQEKLKASAEQSKQKVSQLNDAIQKRKKKLLMKNMNKIKQNLSNEKIKENLLDNNNNTVSDNPFEDSTITPIKAPDGTPISHRTPPAGGSQNNVKSPHSESKSLLTPKSGGFMKSNRSLFDIMAEVQKDASNNASGNNIKELKPNNPFDSSFTFPGEEESYEIIGKHNNNYINNNCSLYNNQHRNGSAQYAIERIDEKTFMDADEDSDEENEDSPKPLTRKITKKGSSLLLATTEEPPTSAPTESAKNNANNPNNNPEAFSDLPAPHAAAAEGDLNRLSMICSLDLALMESLDSVGRQPLFYAAAHCRENIIDFILTLENAFQMFSHADSFGDTVIHSASAGGSVECIEKLLYFHQTQLQQYPLIYEHIFYENNSLDDATKAHLIEEYTHNYVNIKNTTGMTPIHLAGNGPCIEKLIEYGGNINLTDVHLRTPLFIACAINKESCVEYLIGYLDSSEEALLQKDYRGDTPLHAAAANGSVEALLLLLQCGIDPRICNDQGLKAIDLSIRNKHQKCKEILAEYHLHYCTSSEFDSVLFLATLEGHRMVSQLKQFSGGKTSGHLNTAPLGANHNFQSMFSLRSNRTMRLQRYGPWIAYHDPGSHSVFWYNHEQSKGQWETPDIVRQWKSTENGQDSFDKSLNAKMSMRLKREGDWIQYRTEGGKTFYYNEKNCSFQWEDPFITQKAKSKISVQPSSSNEDEGSNRFLDNPQQQQQQQQQQERPQYREEQTEWAPYVDETTGHTFWYNHVTKVSQWENPFEALTYPSQANQQDYRNNHHGQSPSFDANKKEDFDAFPVFHDDDLGL